MKKFFKFHETETLTKLVIFQEVTLQAQKNLKNSP